MDKSEFFTCRDCHLPFPVAESVKDASRKRGIMERCKLCDAKRKKDHRTDNEVQRVKVRDAMRAQRRERKAAGEHWADHLTDEQLEAKRAAQRLRARHARWAKIGASQEYYDQCFEAQGGRCAGCGRDTPGGSAGRQDEVFCIDHDHLTGQLRGLLCNDCNLMVGHALDDPERLAAGIRYLAAWGITGSREETL